MLGTSLVAQWLRILLPGYTPIQNKNFLFFKKKRSGEFNKEKKKKNESTLASRAGDAGSIPGQGTKTLATAAQPKIKNK